MYELVYNEDSPQLINVRVEKYESNEFLVIVCVGARRFQECSDQTQ